MIFKKHKHPIPGDMVWVVNRHYRPEGCEGYDYLLAVCSSKESAAQIIVDDISDTVDDWRMHFEEYYANEYQSFEEYVNDDIESSFGTSLPKTEAVLENYGFSYDADHEHISYSILPMRIV